MPKNFKGTNTAQGHHVTRETERHYDIVDATATKSSHDTNGKKQVENVDFAKAELEINDAQGGGFVAGDFLYLKHEKTGLASDVEDVVNLTDFYVIKEVKKNTPSGKSTLVLDFNNVLAFKNNATLGKRAVTNQKVSVSKVKLLAGVPTTTDVNMPKQETEKAELKYYNNPQADSVTIGVKWADIELQVYTDFSRPFEKMVHNVWTNDDYRDGRYIGVQDGEEIGLFKVGAPEIEGGHDNSLKKKTYKFTVSACQGYVILPRETD